MNPHRRDILKSAGAGVLLANVPVPALTEGGKPMYGLIARAKAVSGHRDALIALRLEGIGTMPACPSCLIARAKPLFARFHEHDATEPVGGQGWVSA